MSDQQLDLVNVISISVLGTQSGLALPNINTAALFSTEAKPGGWGVSQEYAIYTNPTVVGSDFGTSSKAYQIAVAFFAQQPNPLSTNGYLVVVPRNTGAAEKVETAITRIGDKVYYFGILIDEELVEADLITLSAAVQAIDKLLFYASSATADFQPAGMLDDIRTASKTHTRALYYKGAAALDTQLFAAAYAGRGLSTNFDGTNTAQTMHLKSLANIIPDDTVDQTNLDKCKTAGVDCYVNLAGVPSLFTSGRNQFFDEIYNELWFKFALQTAGFNYLRQTNTKIPQTDIGMEGLKNTFRQICSQAAKNGFIGPGAWSSSTVFGDPESLIRNVKDFGYYVYSQPVESQSQANREARIAPLIQIAVKSQGAIHSTNVVVNVNL